MPRTSEVIQKLESVTVLFHSYCVNSYSNPSWVITLPSAMIVEISRGPLYVDSDYDICDALMRA